jgi:ABC-2 type transport system permease protein
MTGNSAFVIRQGRGWQRGLANFLTAELAGWFGTRTWLTHLLIWVGMIDGILLVTLVTMQRDVGAVTDLEVATTGAMIYSIFSGYFAAIGVVIIMQDAIVGEKLSGTAAWVLSKPVSRSAFVLTKLFGNMAGILVMMILIPGLIAYVIISFVGLGEWLPFLPFLAAMACLGVALIFAQTFTLMLGTLFNNRGAVIGLGLAFLFGQQFLVQMMPFLWKILPVGIFLNAEPDAPSLTAALILGQPLPSLQPVWWGIGLSVVFVMIALWRFERTEL